MKLFALDHFKIRDRKGPVIWEIWGKLRDIHYRLPIVQDRLATEHGAGQRPKKEIITFIP